MYKVPPRTQRVRENQVEGVDFVQTGKPCPHPKDIECWHCTKKGHYKSDCSELKIEEGVQNLFAMDEYGRIDRMQ